MQKLNQIQIKRITRINDNLIPQINGLLDESRKWNIEQGDNFLKNLDNALFLAFWKEKVVGFLTAYRLQRFDKRRAEILLYEINVHKDFRQKGIAKMLIAEVKEWGKAVNADELWVLTNKSNIAANALYRSLGGIVENSDDIMYLFKS